MMRPDDQLQPPMKWNAWGDPAAAKPLSDGIRTLLEQALGVHGTPGPELDADQVRLRPSALSAADTQALVDIVGVAHCISDDYGRLLRAGGKSTLDLLRRKDSGVQDAPDAVLLPADDDEVAAVLSHCSRQSIAVVPFGGGTSVVGGLDPIRGDFKAVVSLDLRRLDELHALDEVSGEAELGAGLTGPEAERLLGARGFSLGHFPQSFEFATIGGFAATRSSGQDSAGYGRFDDMVRGVRAVTPAGVLDLGRAPASAAGPDLRQLILGSEGVFGVITRVRVRVHPVPETTRYEAWSFPDFATGAAALRAVAQTGTGPTVIRLSDEAETGVNLATTETIGEQSVTGGCLAITAFEGTAAHTESRHAETRAVLEAHGGTSLGDGPARAWEHGRFGAPYLRDALLSAGALCETLETATNWSNVGALKAAVTEALTAALGGQERSDSGIDTAKLVLRPWCCVTFPMCIPPERRCTSRSSPASEATRSSSGARPRPPPPTRWSAAARPSPTITPSEPITARGCARRSAISVSRCCARSRPCSIRRES